MKTLATLALSAVIASSAALAALAAPSTRVTYAPASEAEIAAAFAEAEATGELVRCVAADTDSGCAPDPVSPAGARAPARDR